MTEKEELRKALIEVMTWIKNWDPNFLDDDNWQEVAESIYTLLKRTKES